MHGVRLVFGHFSTSFQKAGGPLEFLSDVVKKKTSLGQRQRFSTDPSPLMLPHQLIRPRAPFFSGEVGETPEKP